MSKIFLGIGLSYLPHVETKYARVIRGPPNSARDFRNFLIDRFGFNFDDTTLIVDDEPGIEKTADKSTIVKAMIRLVNNSKKGDIIVLYMSGHGGRSMSRYNNNSAYTEYFLAGPHRDTGKTTTIPDYEIREIVASVSDECSFTFIGDCCNAGGLLEGAKELGGISTTTPLTGKQLAPQQYLGKLRPPSKRHLGIFFSACQTGQTTGSVVSHRTGKSSAYFTESMICRVMDFPPKFRFTYKHVLDAITRQYSADRIYNIPGLYCSAKQMNLEFLSLNEIQTDWPMIGARFSQLRNLHAPNNTGELISETYCTNQFSGDSLEDFIAPQHLKKPEFSATHETDQEVLGTDELNAYLNKCLIKLDLHFEALIGRHSRKP